VHGVVVCARAPRHAGFIAFARSLDRKQRLFGALQHACLRQNARHGALFNSNPSGIMDYSWFKFSLSNAVSAQAAKNEKTVQAISRFYR
jgi:hypothetical protein